MRILHVGEVVRGGIVTYLRSIIPAQRSRYGDEAIHGLVPRFYQSDMDGIFARQHWADWHGRSLPSLWRYFRSVRRTIRELAPDIVHAHSSFAGMAVRLAVASMPRDRRPAVVYCAHGWAFLRDTSTRSRRIAALVERLVLRWTTGVIHISAHEAAGAAAFDVRPRLQTTILNGLPDLGDALQTVQADRDRPLDVLFVGRLDRQKGVDILAAVLKDVRRDLVLHIVGDGVISDGKDAKDALQLHDPRLRLHGWLAAEDVTCRYAEADLVIVPSRWEGFGYVAVEAMRAGRAVAASDRGALPEIVAHGVTGYLFDVDDLPGIAALIENADRAQLIDMGQRGRQRYLDHFTATAASSAVLAFYEQLPMPKKSP